MSLVVADVTMSGYVTWSGRASGDRTDPPLADRRRRPASDRRQIVASAVPGEQIEVVGRTATTSMRAYDGQVETLTLADVAGIGVRVVSGGRQGFASAGSLDDDVVDDVLADARDNLSFAEPDAHVLVAVPDGVAPVDLDLWRDDVGHPPTAKVRPGARACEPGHGDRRITGVRTAGYGDTRARR